MKVTTAAGVTSFAATTLLMPVVRSLLRRRRIMDVPTPRSSHSHATPRGAGIACAAGATLSVLALKRKTHHEPKLALGAILAMTVIGTVDDLMGLPAPLRLTAQVATGITAGRLNGSETGSAILGAVSMPALVNAVNFMDGINGISGMTVCAWSTSQLDRQPVTELATLAAAMGGSAIAFLPWNTPKAHIFLGDSGSYFYGAALACSFIQAKPQNRAHVLAPLTPYLFDTAYTLARRAVRGAPLLVAHREHLYQRIQRSLGLPHFVVSAAYGIAAWSVGQAMHRRPLREVTLCTSAAFSTYALTVELLGRLKPDAALRPSGNGAPS